MLKTQKVNLKWHGSNRKMYEEKGYKYTRLGDIFAININDLSKLSVNKVKVICDDCGKEYETKYCNYIIRKNEINADLCKSCITKRTNLKKYGCLNVAQSEEAKSKTKETNLQKYGTEWGLQNKDVIEKRKQTCLNKYGVENVWQSDEIKMKIKETNLKKYGYECNLNEPEIRRQSVIKSRKTLYEKGNAMCSKQQKYLHDLLGGELNYPVDRCSLDIAFPNEMIYIEYDGGGHDLAVKLGMSKEKFIIKEIKRKAYLESLGWKIIRIISQTDLLPSKIRILDLIKEAKNYLNNNHSWFDINIDKLEIKCSEYKKDLILN